MFFCASKVVFVYKFSLFVLSGLYSNKCYCLLRGGVKQADGLLAELMLSSCYDFVEHSCDIVLKHLSIMQKQRFEFDFEFELLYFMVLDDLFAAL